MSDFITGWAIGVATTLLVGYIWLGPFGRGCIKLFGGV